ncbi:uncharacterized protein LOC135377815 [Ornithodoros turicata]|uniref:uncharacterized protein LOC135377815 n=1 Tax=Ornithodoros turicata TaxID=34597 RepID=UPI00313967BF
MESSQTSQQCDTRQYEQFGKHCYLVANYPEVSWATAQRVCSESQAMLAAVRTADQESFLRSLVVTSVARNGFTSTSSWYWVGGWKSATHYSDAGSWLDAGDSEEADLDSNSRDLLVQRYSGAENFNKAAKSLLCLALQWRPHNNATELQWTWKPCEHSGRYICQKSAFTLPTDMNSTFTAQKGTVTSVNFPAHYPNELHYSVSIVGPPGSRVFLSFSRIDLEWQAGCLYDYLELGSPESSSPPVRICGQHELDLDRYDYFSGSNEMHLTFHSDYSIAGAGFSATWEVLDAASACGEEPLTLTASAVNLMWLSSPRFPSTYPTNLHCQYILKSESPELRVLVTVVEFDVGGPTGIDAAGNRGCANDFLNASLGASSGEGRVVSLCGGNQTLQPGFQLLSYGDMLTLDFSSAPHRTRRNRGFNITYQAWNEASLETVLRLTERSRGFLRSLNHPHRPPKGINYAIRLVAPLRYRIELGILNGTAVKKMAPEAFITVRDPYRRPERPFEILSSPLMLEAVNVTATSTLHVFWFSYAATVGPFEASYIVRKDSSFSKTTSILLDASLDSCFPNFCYDSAACIKHMGKIVCDCKPPTAGLFCHVTVCDVGEPCSRQGNCSVSPAGTVECSCRPGFFGSDCSLRTSPCEGSPCGSHGRCVAVNGTYVCHCNIFFEGSRCEKQVFRIPYRPLSQRMLEEPFWLGLITVSAVLLLILLVYCIKRKFADKIEKFLAEEIERSKNNPSPPATRYSLSSTRPSLTPASLSPQPCQRSLLSRIRRHSVRSGQGGSSPSDKDQAAFSFDDLLKRSSQSSGSKKHSTNSSDSENPPPSIATASLPKEKDPETSRILASLVTSTKSPGKRRMSLDEFIKLSERKIHSIKREETPGDISDVSVASEGSVETSFMQRLTANEFHSIKEQSFEQNSSSDSLSAGPKTSEVQVEVTPAPESPSKTTSCADAENAIREEKGCAESVAGDTCAKRPVSPHPLLEQQSSEDSSRSKEVTPRTPSPLPHASTTSEPSVSVPKVEGSISPKHNTGDAKEAFLDLLQKTMLAASPTGFLKPHEKQEPTQITMMSLPKTGSVSKPKAADLSMPRKYSVELPMPKILITANMSSCESEEAPSPPRTPNPSTKTMNYLSPLTIMCSSADRTISESNLSTSGYSSLSSPGLSRCNSTSPIADELENTGQHARRKEYFASPQKCHSLSPNHQACKTFQFPATQAYPCLDAHRPTSPLLQKRRSSVGGPLCPSSLKDRVGLKGKYRSAASRHNYQTTSTEDSVDDEGIGIDIAEIKFGKSCIRGGGSVDIILDTGKFDIPERDISRDTSPFSKSMSLESPRCSNRKGDKYRKTEKHRRLTPGNSPGLSPSAESLPAELGTGSTELKLSRNPSKSSMASATQAPSSSDTDDAEVRPQRRPCKKPDSRSSGKGSAGGDSRAVSPSFVCRSSSSSDSLPSTNDDVVGTDCSSTDNGPDSRPPYSELAIVIDPGPRQRARYGAQTIELYPCLPNPRLRVHPPSPVPPPERREESTNTPRFFHCKRNVPALKLISPEGSTFKSLSSSGESSAKELSPKPIRRYSFSPPSGTSQPTGESDVRSAASQAQSHHQMLRRQEALIEDDGSDESISETTVLLPRVQQDSARDTLIADESLCDALDELYDTSSGVI